MLINALCLKQFSSPVLLNNPEMSDATTTFCYTIMVSSSSLTNTP